MLIGGCVGQRNIYQAWKPVVSYKRDLGKTRGSVVFSKESLCEGWRAMVLVLSTWWLQL